ncbi:ABC transporter permease [Amycolatopsis sp. NPDC051372]|uniref:ABC transporter permease n=1 Tax=Amycolatopsis sp. NPDC051372 TaxID=3155669 RepID=UPI00341E0900
MKYTARRLGTALLVLFLSSLAVFGLLRMAPGDPATILAGQDASPAQVEQIRHALGLDESLPAQYWHWLTGLLTGNPGQSYIFKQSIGDLVGQRLGNTVQLLVLSTLVMIVLGTILGVSAAVATRGPARTIVDLLSTIALATPPFVSSIVFIFLFAVSWRLLPVGGQWSFFDAPTISVQFLIMPAIAVALPGSAVVARLLATEMRRTFQEEFARTAQAKGASRGRIVVRHVIPNSLGPAVVEVGIRIGELFAGAVVVEAIFTRSGLGSLLVTAVQNRDYLLAQDLLLLSVAFAIVMQLLTEIGISRVDRRIAIGKVLA